MSDHTDFVDFAARNSLAVVECWMRITDIWAAYLGVKPPPKLLGYTVERNGDSKLIRPNVQGWSHLTLDKDLQAK